MINVSLENQESTFKSEEIFISKTDKRGVIEYGNSVFTRVSGYAEDQLIGAPHKIIRHRDMPRSVFKLFWDTIQKGEPIIAYVKNRAIDGKYYWVLATCYPSSDNLGYLSIRIKPLTELKNAAENLYKQVIQIEQEKGMEEGIKYILGELKKLGFNSYEEFMIHSLYEELSARQKAVRSNYTKKYNTQDQQLSALVNTFTEMKTLSVNSIQRFSQAVLPLKEYLKSKEEFETGAAQIAQVCERLEFLSVNMSISAHKLGKLGGTLSVVANSFQTTAQKIVKDFEDFQKKSVQIADRIQNIFLNLGCATVQNEMLGFSLGEILEKLTTRVEGVANKPMSLEIEHSIKQTEELIKNIEHYFKPVFKEAESFYGLINANHRNLVQLGDLVTQLDLIKTGGKLEGSRSNEIVQSFEPFIIEMNEFIEGVQTPVQKIMYLIKGLETAFADILAAGNHIEHASFELHFLLNNLKTAAEELFQTETKGDAA
ncbi:MAG: PAS domain-containing protein [Pseudobdellovibrio sp.]